MISVSLLFGKDKLPLNHHPWIFSGAIAGMSGTPGPGEVVAVLAHDGRFIAYGHHNPTSKIRLRLLEWDRARIPDAGWYRERLRQALELRRGIFADGRTTAARLVFSEADFLPGLIIDRFGQYAVLQFATAGMEAAKTEITAAFTELFTEFWGTPIALVERGDGDGRHMEGLPNTGGILYGEVPAGPIQILENGHPFAVDLVNGQKTGFYADQRENRRLVAPWLQGRRILDLCCYTGGFSLYGLAAGAVSADLVDVSGWALEQAAANLQAAGFSNFTCTEENAFRYLRRVRESRKNAWDAIILDPPKLAPTRADVDQAMRGYKDLNLQALAALPPGGLLATFSCSGLVSQAMFREVVAYAAKDAGRDVQILLQLHQGTCHPIRASFPESEYLKGLLLRVQ